MLPPENFAMVEAGIYRSAFPRSKNIPFLRRLRLRSVLALVPEDISETMTKFYAASNIRLIKHGTDGNKWPFKEICDDEVVMALRDALNPANQPVLLHCNKGKHRTGSVVGALRKVRGWGMSSIFAEYLAFAQPKARLEDQRFIEVFDDESFRRLIEAEEEGERQKQREKEKEEVEIEGEATS
jgi:tyrosine-protein phosphatase SIW14